MLPSTETAFAIHGLQDCAEASDRSAVAKLMDIRRLKMP